MGVFPRYVYKCRCFVLYVVCAHVDVNVCCVQCCVSCGRVCAVLSAVLLKCTSHSPISTAK